MIALPGYDVIDHSKLDTEGKIANLPVTINLRRRHLESAVLSGANLRKADFTGAWLQGVRLNLADLRESKFDCGAPSESAPARECVQLQDSFLPGARLQGASLEGANLQGANLSFAQLQGASLLKRPASDRQELAPVVWTDFRER